MINGFLLSLFFHCKSVFIADLYILIHLFDHSISHFFRPIQQLILHFFRPILIIIIHFFRPILLFDDSSTKVNKRPILPWQNRPFSSINHLPHYINTIVSAPKFVSPVTIRRCVLVPSIRPRILMPPNALSTLTSTFHARGT